LRHRGAFVPHQGRVRTRVRAVDEPAEQGAGLVVFRDQRAAVVEAADGDVVGGDRVIDVGYGFVEAPERIVAQVGGVDPACRYQPVLDVIDPGVGAIAGEVAVRIIVVGDALHGDVLVQAVADIAVIEVARVREGVGIVALAAAGDLPGGVEGRAEHIVLACARSVRVRLANRPSGR
jgi:hypothetical protein